MPAALRLIGPAGRAPKPPFGLAAWTDDATDVAVLLDVPREWPASGMGALAVIASQVPRAADVAPGALVVLLGDAPASGGLFARLRRPAHVARALRCSALLANGYGDVGAGVDANGIDLAWGVAPS